MDIMDIMDGGYAHRFNPNGSVDSICRRCFTTVATEFNEANLDDAEGKHICNPEDKLRSNVLAEEARLR